MGDGRQSSSQAWGTGTGEEFNSGVRQREGATPPGQTLALLPATTPWETQGWITREFLVNNFKEDLLGNLRRDSDYFSNVTLGSALWYRVQEAFVNTFKF